MKFSFRNSTYEVLRTAPSTVGGGWTHSAEVKRLNGKKTYYANLVVENGQVVHAFVVS
jgi:hypothetical protein